MPVDRLTLRVAVNLILERDGLVLLLRRHQTGWEDGNYAPIAGHLEAGETVREAVAREAREEAGVRVDPADLRLVHLMHRHEGAGYVDVFFVAERWEGEPIIGEPDRCDDLLWCSQDQLPQNMVPYAAAGLRHYGAAESYSEFGWDETAPRTGRSDDTWASKR